MDIVGWAPAGARLEFSRATELLKAFDGPRDRCRPVGVYVEAGGDALLAMNRALAMALDRRGGSLVD